MIFIWKSLQLTEINQQWWKLTVLFGGFFEGGGGIASRSWQLQLQSVSKEETFLTF